ncbi:MAG: 50S ribosomal protein L19 [Caldisericia bacterium]|nr:50S ribosomal protein L19 [Caldisericia bacterium]
MQETVRNIVKDQLKKDPKCFEIGDTVKVFQKITEGAKTRIQLFEGTVIARKHGGVQETLTVRKVVKNLGIEKVFPLHSPLVDRIEVLRHGKIRRAKLYYLRDRIGKKQRLKDRIVRKVKTQEQQPPKED